MAAGDIAAFSPWLTSQFEGAAEDFTAGTWRFLLCTGADVPPLSAVFVDDVLAVATEIGSITADPGGDGGVNYVAAGARAAATLTTQTAGAIWRLKLDNIILSQDQTDGPDDISWWVLYRLVNDDSDSPVYLRGDLGAGISVRSNTQEFQFNQVDGVLYFSVPQ